MPAKAKNLVATDRVEVNVSIDEAYLDKFDQVIESGKKAGLQVTQTLETIGVLSGTIDSTKIQTLEQVEGVADVEVTRHYQAAPPSSIIQSQS